MRLWILLLLGVFGLNFAQAGIFDFKDIDKAKEAYKKKNYDATIAHLNSLKDSIKDPALEYDLGNAYYKKGKYEEALKHYEKAKGVDEANRLYNTGNAYANSGDIESAIDAYEQSLKIRDDADTRKNLEILKQKKKEQEQKDQKNQQDKKDEKNQDQNKNKQDKEKQNQKNQDQKKDDNASQKKSPEQDKKESSEDQ
ncbi:MAG: tetratricopeptide repeat protein [Sulfurovaceae bacterium]